MHFPIANRCATGWIYFLSSAESGRATEERSRPNVAQCEQCGRMR